LDRFVKHSLSITLNFEH